MALEVWTAVVVVAATIAILGALRTFLWEPLRLRRCMKKQGVHGPPFRFVVGNLPEAEAFRQSQPEIQPFEYIFRPTVNPQHALFFPKYGKRFIYGYGSDTRLVVREPEFVKEVLMTQSDSFRRTDIEKYVVGQVTGNGIFIIDGPKWYMERHTLNPFFRQTALKDMMEAMVRGASSEIEKWEQTVAQAGGTTELDVVPGIQALSSKVLTYTAFSSAEYEKGNQIFHLQIRIVSLVVELLYSSSFWIPGYRFLPTKINRELAQCQAKVDKLLYGIINDRIRAMKEGKIEAHCTDLLGRMIAAASEGTDPNAQEFNLASVFANTKNLYFAGHDTTSNMLCFAMPLFGRHPEWQERARQEVLEVMGDEEHFDFAALSRLKVVTMFIHEVIRVYTLTPILARVAVKDVKICDLVIPKGVTIELAMQEMHVDPDYWGKDASEFNPGRFANGVPNASTHIQGFTPFGIGPKHCIGMSFALMEMKIVMCMVLRRFHVSMSPNYKHHPTDEIIQKPKYGVPIILTRL